MATVSIKDANSRLAELVREAENGEPVTITRNGQPVVDLVPHKKKKGIDWEAGERFLREHGATEFFSYVAPDFDDESASELPGEMGMSPEILFSIAVDFKELKAGEART